MSDKPVRIQRKRTKGWRMPPNTVSVTRPGPWGNPYKVGRHPTYGWCAQGEGKFELARNRDDALDKVIALFRRRMKHRELSALRGKNLACFCALDQPCHADVLLELANSVSPT